MRLQLNIIQPFTLQNQLISKNISVIYHKNQNSINMQVAIIFAAIVAVASAGILAPAPALLAAPAPIALSAPVLRASPLLAPAPIALASPVVRTVAVGHAPLALAHPAGIAVAHSAPIALAHPTIIG